MISEMTESKKCQPLYRFVDGLRWVWTCLFCICLYISYINTLYWDKAINASDRVLVLGAWQITIVA